MDEEHEEKTGDLERATHDGDDVDRSPNSQPDHIPLDLTLEILSRLPAKSLLRYQCVSKFWSSLTTLPSFINSFGSRSSARPPQLLLSFVLEERKRIVFSFPQHHNPSRSYSPEYSYQITERDWDDTMSDSVHGLILLDRPVIWNPSLKLFLTLPKPPKNTYSNGVYILGYDPLEGKHRVLYLDGGFSSEPQVLTLGARESWRMITNVCPIHSPTGKPGACFNGVLYYTAYFDIGGRCLIVSFQVRSEKFHMIEFPKNVDYFSNKMIHYEGRLTLVTTSSPFYSVDLYILKDADGHEWTHKQFLHVPCQRKFWKPQHLFCQGVTDDDAGELIFAPFSVRGSVSVLYFDPKRNSFREVVFEGILDDEFRCRYGLIPSNGRRYMNVFPNHMENLVAFL